MVLLIERVNNILEMYIIFSDKKCFEIKLTFYGTRVINWYNFKIAAA